MARKPKTVTARETVPACLVWNSDSDIAKGEKRQVAREYWYNGEGWYQFTDGTKAPDVFFD